MVTKISLRSQHCLILLCKEYTACNNQVDAVFPTLVQTQTEHSVASTIKDYLVSDGRFRR